MWWRYFSSGCAEIEDKSCWQPDRRFSMNPEIWKRETDGGPSDKSGKRQYKRFRLRRKLDIFGELD